MKLNSDLSELITWRLIGSVTGANQVAISADDYNEFYIIQSYMDNNINRTVSYIIPSAIMTSNAQNMYNGYSYSSSNAKMFISFTNTSILNGSFSYEGSDKTASSAMKVYAR